MRSKVYCINCNKYVPFYIKEQELTGAVNHLPNAIQYTYKGKQAYCTHCGKEVFVPEVQDYNLDALFERYDQTKGIDKISLV